MSLSPEDIEEIKKTISSEVEICVKNRFKPVLSKLDNIQSVADLLNNDLSEDRKMLAEMVGSQAKVEKLAVNILEIISTQTNRIVDRVNNQAEEVKESALQAVVDNVEPAMANAMHKVRNGIPLNKRKPWWKFW